MSGHHDRVGPGNWREPTDYTLRTRIEIPRFGAVETDQ
jgi:hypothetical protein